MDSPGKEHEDGKAGEAELRALIGRSGRRMQQGTVAGRPVWVKRFDVERQPFAKRLHALVSPLLHPVHLRASRPLDAAGMAEREVRKAAKFRAAGFPAPEVLRRERGILVLSDMGPSVKARLAKSRRGDAAAHAGLIVACAAALGGLHAAGLCHGRPHPRDMCVAEDGRVGFFDFEEEPEAVMPLAAAQARDLWSFFLHVSLLKAHPGTLETAVSTYRARAPESVLPQVKPLLRVFRPAVVASAFLPAFLVHHDYERIIAASKFLEPFV